jgi:acylphosphatase
MSPGAWIARRCLVSGRVQGVFYRASARTRAQELGVTGYARNLPDGRVEVLACGDPEAVASLCRWLWQGSPASHVTAIDESEVDTAMVGEWPAAFRTA